MGAHPCSRRGSSARRVQAPKVALPTHLHLSLPDTSQVFSACVDIRDCVLECETWALLALGLLLSVLCPLLKLGAEGSFRCLVSVIINLNLRPLLPVE